MQIYSKCRLCIYGMRGKLVSHNAFCADTKKASVTFVTDALSGMDGTRTRDPMRDRHVF